MKRKRASHRAVVTTIAVTGSYRVEATLRAVAAALRSIDPFVVHASPTGAFRGADPRASRGPLPSGPALLRGCAEHGGKHLMGLEHQTALGFAIEHALAVVVFTGLSEADLPAGRDPESHLAEKAQLFLGRRGLHAVVLNADDLATDLLAEVLPQGVRVLRYGTARTARGRLRTARGRLRTARGRLRTPATALDLLATRVLPTGSEARVWLTGSRAFSESIAKLSCGRGREAAPTVRSNFWLGCPFPSGSTQAVDERTC